MIRAIRAFLTGFIEGMSDLTSSMPDNLIFAYDLGRAIRCLGKKD